MSVLASLLSNYKTTAAAIASLFIALASFLGFVPGVVAVVLGACCYGIAHAFKQISDHGVTVEDLKADVAGANRKLALFESALKGLLTAEQLAALQAEVAADSAAESAPSTIKFPGVPMLLLGLLLLSSSAIAQDRPTVPTSMQLSPETRSFYKNPDGSCVQCSIGMAGVHCNDLNAASLLWDTAYGPAVRGGSWPSRVESYCDQRGIKAWSVTGNTVEDTMPWIVWAARTGRFAAIGAGTSHFQTLYGYEPNTDKPWLVCNNNSTSRIDRYSDREFRQLHAASGPWVVILEKPSSEPPSFVKWWK